jgi:hypothetical protein
MDTREIGLLIAAVISVVLIFINIKKLNTLEDKHKISKSKKDILVFITILVPLIGFLIIYIFTKRINENIA